MGNASKLSLNTTKSPYHSHTQNPDDVGQTSKKRIRGRMQKAFHVTMNLEIKISTATIFNHQSPLLLLLSHVIYVTMSNQGPAGSNQLGEVPLPQLCDNRLESRNLHIPLIQELVLLKAHKSHPSANEGFTTGCLPLFRSVFWVVADRQNSNIL